MSHTLFINSNEAFTNRIRKEAGPDALITSNMDQGARWVADPEMQVKAVFLNPNDTSYSALKFLELSLAHRPATPVYLIDSDGEIKSDQQKEFFEKNHVQGVFTGQESYHDFLAKLNAQSHPNIAAIPKRSEKKSQIAGYVAVPILDFLYSKSYLFDVFVEGDGGKLNLFATAGSPVEQEYLARALDKTLWFYIAETAVQEVKDNLKNTQIEAFEMADFPISWKTAEALYRAKHILNELHKNGICDDLVYQTHDLIGDVFQVVSQLQAMNSSEQLGKFIEQAKNCDRAIAGATYSILMCKALKFEKNAIVEILGLASLFQDISLYNSPYGNLAEVEYKLMTPEAQSYYQKHPLVSSDLLAQNTSVPDVTLQVIRQHHERKDRTGFPGRVGGMQLHPMAEILSMINEFIDEDPQTPEQENEIFRHFSDRIVAAFKQIQMKVKRPSSMSNTIDEKVAA